MSEMLRTGKSAVVIAMVVLAYCAFAEGQTAAAIVTVVVGAGVLLALQKLTKHCVQSEQSKQGFWRRILYTVIDNRSVVYMILMATMISSYRDWMSAAFNFLGVFVMTQINSSVASTISNMVDFGADTDSALIALCAALLSIVVYSVGASIFGIPTSESHSLIAGLSGAAIAIQGGVGGINFDEWVKVLYGLALSLLLGFATGWAICKLVSILCYNVELRAANRFFRVAQIAGAAAMSFMHGAQDGQKFIGVLFLGLAFAHGQGSVAGMEIPVWLMLLCSVVMALGTSVGGEKIIKSVGMDMVKLERYQGFCADVAGALCLLYSSLFGIPVSTTHTKTSAIMGVGAVKRLSAINYGVVKDMMLTWIFTFPGCGLISFVMAKVFMQIW